MGCSRSGVSGTTAFFVTCDDHQIADSSCEFIVRVLTRHAAGTTNMPACAQYPELRVCRLFFFSVDRGEPMHVHVAKGRAYAKFWMQPLALARPRNLGSRSRCRHLPPEPGDDLPELRRRHPANRGSARW
jgi:hypothetical protein